MSVSHDRGGGRTLRRAATTLAVLFAFAAPVRAAGIPLADIPGFVGDDLTAAFTAFRRSCTTSGIRTAAGPALAAPPASLGRICRAARALPDPDSPAVADFLQRHFDAHTVGREDETGLLTGYYEPEVPGSLVRSEAFPTPLLAPPARPPSPFPDRAEIEDGALSAAARPVVHLRDPVDAFTIHIQGSSRIRLPDGRIVRVAFAGRNGHAYTSIGRILADRLGVTPAEMPASRLYEWLRAHPGEGRDLMRQNRSYIFFRLDRTLGLGEGPRGGAGNPLTPGRSLAIDRSVWPYGVPIWLAGAGNAAPRLVVTQDTGASIRGAMRGDLFVGTGEEAGRAAGALRDRVRFIVLWPKGDPLPGPLRDGPR